MRSGFVIAAAALGLATAVCAQPRPATDKARVALTPGGGLAGGAYKAAIVIDLAPDTITYWRNPGEAGVPPAFDWSGSANVAKVEVAMPPPERISEAGGDVFGYRNRVAYVATVTPQDAGKPVALAMKMDYAACEKICIPMHAEAKVDLAPTGAPGADAAAVEAAVKLLPRLAQAEEVALLTPVAGGGKPAWRVEPKISGASDLFPEAPDGFFFETARDGAAFRLTLVERPANAPAGPVPVTLTMPAAGGAVQFDARLDAAVGKP